MVLPETEVASGGCSVRVSSQLSPPSPSWESSWLSTLVALDAAKWRSGGIVHMIRSERDSRTGCAHSFPPSCAAESGAPSAAGSSGSAAGAAAGVAAGGCSVLNSSRTHACSVSRSSRPSTARHMRSGR